MDFRIRNGSARERVSAGGTDIILESERLLELPPSMAKTFDTPWFLSLLSIIITYHSGFLEKTPSNRISTIQSKEPKESHLTRIADDLRIC